MNWQKDLEMFSKQDSLEINKLKGTDVTYYLLENFNPSLPSYVSWHIENCELSGIKNKYDKGWYDALVMIKKYFESEQCSEQFVELLKIAS